MKLTIGFSPCPNDTFIFEALITGAIDTGDWTFEPVLEDVETLNQWALEGRLDVTKLSFPAYFRSREHYILLASGGAMGIGVGPLLVTADPQRTQPSESDWANSRVLLPGQNTTANLLFSHFYQTPTKTSFGVFSSIEDALLRGDADYGVLIHESRFTYHEKGLHLVADLGSRWEAEWQVPLPLGGIAIRRDLSAPAGSAIEKFIRYSADIAFSRYPQLGSFITENAQTMEESVMRRHIELYVNRFSLDMGQEGRKAVSVLKSVYDRLHPDNIDEWPLFLTEPGA